MQMWPVRQLSAVPHESNDFSGVNKCTNFFIKFCIVLINGNQVGAVLDHDHIARILRPGGEQNSSIRDALYGLIGFSHNVHPIVSLFNIVTIRYETGDGREEEGFVQLLS